MVCLTRRVDPGWRVERSDIQHTTASMSWVTVGRFCSRQIMSPRETAISSVRVRVTAIGLKASVRGPAGESMALMVDV